MLRFASPTNSNTNSGSASTHREHNLVNTRERSELLGSQRIENENNTTQPIKRTSRKHNAQEGGYCQDSSQRQPGKGTAVPGAAGAVAMRDVSSISLYQDGTIKSLPAQ